MAVWKLIGVSTNAKRDFLCLCAEHFKKMRVEAEHWRSATMGEIINVGFDEAVDGGSTPWLTSIPRA